MYAFPHYMLYDLCKTASAIGCFFNQFVMLM